jgi:hypothetical protein
MADYIQRLYQARQSRDSPEPFLDVLIPRNSWDSKQVSMAPSNLTQDTYSRLMDHKSHVTKKVSDLRKKKKADELGYKGISPDRKKVNKRKENMLINRLDSIIADKEKKIEKQRQNISIERDLNNRRECTFKPTITARGSSSKKRTIDDLENWHKQKMKNRMDRIFDLQKIKPTFKPKINETPWRIAEVMPRERGVSVEDRL